MSDRDWVTVKQYDDFTSVEIGARLLSGLGIPNRIDRPTFRRFAEWCDLWVPPEFAEDAKKALGGGSVSDEELTRLALQSPSPDDA
jgi:hypothetical protein